VAKFYSHQVKRKIKDGLLGRYRRAGEWLKNRIRDAVSISNQGGKYPSAPGAYPHAGTKTFWRSIVSVVNTAEGWMRVGSTDPKAKWLQNGTRYMAPRPWYTLAVQEFKEGVGKILRGGK
jgi:hypothetical protein